MTDSGYNILVQIIGFIGVLFFFASYQVKSNKRLFILQTLGCLTFSVQFALLGAYSGCMSLLINIARNALLTKYHTYKWVQWKGWVFVFSALCIVSALATWGGAMSILPVIGTISGTAAYWTNNARKIRIVNLTINAPCLLIYDVLVKSWGGVLSESVTIASILVSIYRFGWKALDGDTIEKR